MCNVVFISALYKGCSQRKNFEIFCSTPSFTDNITVWEAEFGDFCKSCADRYQICTSMKVHIVVNERRFADRNCQVAYNQLLLRRRPQFNILQ